MKRKNFLMTSIAAIPAIAFGTTGTSDYTSKEPFIVKNGDNRSAKPMMKYMGAHPNDVVVSRHDTNNKLAVFIFTGYGNIGTPLHIHYHQDETFTVIEGKYRFVCGEMNGELNEGDTIFLPRNIPHQWLQISDKGKLIYSVTPAGELEDFFKEANDLKMPTEEQINNLALKHGIRHIGPPLTV